MSASLMLLCGLLAAPSPHLAEGIRLYRAQNYSEALEALTRAIDEPNSSRDKARIHVYIGLIQFRFSMTRDASASFEQALDYDANLQLPKKHTHPNARRLFAKIKRERFGDEKAPKPRNKRKGRRSKRNGDPPDKVDREPPSKAEPGSDPKLEVEPEPPPPVAPPPPAITAPPPPPPKIEPPPPPPPALTPSTTVTQAPEVGPNLPAWISIGAGAAAVVAAGVVGGLSAYNIIGADGETYAATAEERFQTGVKQRTGAIIAGSIGVVGLGVGATLFLIE